MVIPEPFDFLFILDCLIKGFLVLLVALSADLLLRRSAATVRHLVWVLASAAVLLCPFVSLLVPQVDLLLFSVGTGAAEVPLNPEGMNLDVESASGLPGTEILLHGYVLGVVLVLVWQLVGRLYANRLRRRAQLATEPGLLRVFRHVKGRLGFSGEVALVMSDVASIPFSTGFFRPAVVLPATAGEWPSDVLRTVLVHELGHIKRRDVLTRALAQLSCSLHWVNPVAWYGLRRILIEQEIACDDLVLKSGTKPSAYARALLVLARAGGGKLSFVTTALGRHGELKDRLLEILKPRRSKAPLGTSGVLAGLCVALILLAPLSALNLWEPHGAQENPNSNKVGVEPETKTEQFEAQLLAEAEKMKETELEKTGLLSDAPDVEKLKDLIKKKTQGLKTSGASEKELNDFLAEANLKLAELEKESKEAKEEAEAKPAEEHEKQESMSTAP